MPQLDNQSARAGRTSAPEQLNSPSHLIRNNAFGTSNEATNPGARVRTDGSKLFGRVSDFCFRSGARVKSRLGKINNELLILKRFLIH